ncbi:MAG: hypothetical protein KID09_22565, partial [Paenibacillus macerans]|uniref:hypothetical protein n=1 Tax=Paenibacillus macerans TaxID=44252 RepID=UPI0024317A55
PSSADGTWTEGSWESRTPPSMKKSTADHSAVFFCIFGMLQRDEMDRTLYSGHQGMVTYDSHLWRYF